MATGRYQLSLSAAGSWFEQHVAHETAAEADDDADDRDAEQVDAPLGQARGEHRALDGADRDREEVEPERDDEERGGHGISEP